MDMLVMMKKSLLVLSFISMQLVGMDIKSSLRALQKVQMQQAEQTCTKHETRIKQTIFIIGQKLLKETGAGARVELKNDLTYFQQQWRQHCYMKKALGMVTVASFIRNDLLEEQRGSTRGTKRNFNHVKEGQIVVEIKRRKLDNDSYEGRYRL